MERVTILQGDITRLEVDAIVNAAKRSLLGGGGVDGAIHRAAGPELLDYCRVLGGCETGQATLTPGFKLPAKHVIHTVGPVWEGGGAHEDELLASCYRECLRVAEKNGVASVAFPAISTGVFGFPAKRAARIAAQEIAHFLENHALPERVLLVGFDAQATEILREALDSQQVPSAPVPPRLQLQFGDIVGMQVDAIVNSTDSTMLDGGPVHQAVHAAAGSALAKACERFGECRPGEIRLTPGYQLKAPFIIHTVAPTWIDGLHGEPEILGACYTLALALASERGFKSIAFPSIGSGRQPQIPLEVAAMVAVRSILAHLDTQETPEKVVLVCFDAHVYQAYRNALKEVLP